MLSAPACAPAAAQGRGPTPVSVCPVEQRDVPPSIRLVGNVMADRNSVVAAEVGGVIVEYAAAEGQLLARGDVICRIDPAVAKMRHEEALATLELYKAKLQELENGTRPEELERLKASMEEAEALYKNWEIEKRRVDELYEIQQANVKEKRDADTEYVAAARRYTQAKARFEEARNGPRPEVIAQARQEMAAQKAVAERLERDHRKTEIRAPFEGFVVAKRTEVGEWIDAGGPVAELVAIGTVKIRVDVPESAIPFARPGQVATVESEALGKTFSTKIARVIPMAKLSGRSFPVEIDLDNPEHALLPGMFVWARVPSGPPGRRLMVSRDAIVPRGPTKQIFVIRPGEGGASMAMPMNVTTGLEIDDLVEVDAPGVQPGDMVVCRANERLFGPSPVIPMPLERGRPPSTMPADETASK
jgi:multidrug efflux pump subunit AcrA (membrane-fusion protein)